MKRRLAELVPSLATPKTTAAFMRRNPVGILLAVAVVTALLSGFLAFNAGAETRIVLLGGYLVLDATSRLFLLLVNLIFLGIATHIWTRVEQTPALAEGMTRFVPFALVFLVAGNLAIVSHHLVAMWVFLEATTLAAVPLIQHGGGAQAYRASWRYFLFSGVGLSFTFLGFLCLAHGLEPGGNGEFSFFLDELGLAARRPMDVWGRMGLALVFLGYGTKLGLAPMHAWLPETYHAAPPPVTALLAAVQFNVAVVAVFRVLQVFRGAAPDLISQELVAMGVATMVMSSAGIVLSHNYKKLIAYASLNHGGVIAIGLGIGKSAAYGVVLYVVSNAFIKAILFLTAGKIRAHYKTEDVREISGLIKDLPYTGLFFMIGTFALLGLPPFGSFLGELLIMGELVRGGYLVVFAAFGAILTATFVATGRSIFPMIWGEPRKKADWGSQSVSVLVPKLLFIAALIVLGVYVPAPLNALFREVAAGLGAQ